MSSVPRIHAISKSSKNFTAPTSTLHTSMRFNSVIISLADAYFQRFIKEQAILKLFDDKVKVYNKDDKQK